MAERFLTSRQELPAIRNFLLLQHPLALGTAVHATPLIPALHRTIPGARVIAAASGFAADILRGNPGLEALIVTPSPLADFPGAVRGMRRAKAFEEEPYAVLQTTGGERTGLALAAMLSGGHTRVGFTVRPELSAAPLVFDPSLSQIENNLRLIGALGHGVTMERVLAEDPDLMEPRVYPAMDDDVRAEELLQARGIDTARPLAIFITQTSPTQRKSWRAARFQAVAEMLAREYDMQVAFAGTKKEIAAIDELRAPFTMPNVNVAGQTSLLELSALMRMADVALSLDTGPMHLARAVRLPTVVIAPAWSPPLEWLPLGNPRARILKNLDLPTAPADYVIDEVSAEEVEATLRELLTLYPPREFSWRDSVN